MENITDINVYTSEMERALQDKLFFSEHIKNIDTFVDFGCANGILLKQLQTRCYAKNFIGIDMNEEMLYACKLLLQNVKLYEDYLPRLPKNINLSNSALNLSSVIHEVYSYSDNVDDFWNTIKQQNYTYIFIRDMSSDLDRHTLSNEEDVNKILSKSEYQKQVEDFEKHWGSLTSQYNLLHFLLKYRYKMNWSRELLENYLPISTTDLIQNFKNCGYEPIFTEIFTLPFLKEQVKYDFDINLEISTHLKLILKKAR